MPSLSRPCHVRTQALYAKTHGNAYRYVMASGPARALLSDVQMPTPSATDDRRDHAVLERLNLAAFIALGDD